MNQSYLVLETEKTFAGKSPLWQKNSFSGEVVFTTGMTGYVETLTDPSYTGQIVVFTYPLIGNYGVPNKKLWESKKIHAAGVVVSEVCKTGNHTTSKMNFLEWLEKEKVPLITDVDTRAITKILRESGVLLGAIQTSEVKNRNEKFYDPNTDNLVARVSPKKKERYGNGKKIIYAVDCGMKENIIRCLLEYDVTVYRVPYNYDYTNEKWDGVFLSNGPGNPVMVQETIDILKKAMTKQKPIFGICLGTQLMALAAGANTYKLKYGHRGHNQPCVETSTDKCIITSQNHGYAIDETTLPPDWYVSFKNLNDQSVEGIAHATLPFFAVQFHPEAAPGPTDATYLFQKFFDFL